MGDGAAASAAAEAPDAAAEARASARLRLAARRAVEGGISARVRVPVPMGGSDVVGDADVDEETANDDSEDAKPWWASSSTPAPSTPSPPSQGNDLNINNDDDLPIRVDALLTTRASEGMQRNKAAPGFYRSLLLRTPGVDPTHLADERRVVVFADNVDGISELAATVRGSAVAPNFMATLTDLERADLRSKFTPLPPGEQEAHRRRRRRAQAVKLPASVDWRAANAVTDVKQQGSCGACYAFAATGVLEGHFAIRYGFLVSLSEQQLVSCDHANNAGCRGGNFLYSLRDYVAPFALGVGQAFPYGSTQACPDVSAIPTTATASLRTVSVSADVVFVDRSEQALQEAVAQGPVAVAVSGYEPIFMYYTSGIISDAAACGTKVDHAALVVGYGTATDGRQYWLLKSSWGTAFGENGYVRLLRGDAGVLQQTNGLGMCGVLTQANTVSDVSCAPGNGLKAPCVPLASTLFCTADKGCVASSTTSTTTSRGNGTTSTTTNNNGGGFFNLGGAAGSPTPVMSATAFLAGMGIAAALVVAIGVVGFFVVRARRARAASSLSLPAPTATKRGVVRKDSSHGEPARVALSLASASTVSTGAASPLSLIHI